MEKEFEALRESNREEVKQLEARLIRKNRHLKKRMLTEGICIEYVPDYDHLYVTLGQPRVGMAFFTDDAVLMADPQTLELIAFEIPDFMRQVADGKQPELGSLAPTLNEQPVIEVPPAAQAKQAAKRNGAAPGDSQSIHASVLAQAEQVAERELQRKLAAV